MQPTGILLLEFHPERDDLGSDKELRDGLSVVLQMGDTLWVANDETISLERLTLADPDQLGRYTIAAEHKQFSLADFLQLPVPPDTDSTDIEEVDIEGLALGNEYLWLVGSHSLKRKLPSSKDAKKSRKELSKISVDGNRYLLARIPVVQVGDTFELVKKTEGIKKHLCAAQLAGDATGNELTIALAQDEHIGPFLSIPGKDNGFDIEGLAVSGKRVFLGLRGPVMRGWAVILEIEPVEDCKDPSTLKLNPIGPNNRVYRKHFLHLGGLGIRDLCLRDSDLLILAGPTMDLDGPVTVFGWPAGSAPKKESVVSNEELERLLELPFGRGVDRPEGICLFTSERGKSPSLLVVYDAASVNRQIGQSTLASDVFAFPSPGKSKRS